MSGAYSEAMQNESIAPEVKLEHAFLSVADLDASLGFYRKLFPDWDVRWSGTHNRGGRWVHFGDSRAPQASYLSLAERADARRGPEQDGALITIDHLGFAHSDVQALVKRAEGSGLQPSQHFVGDGFRRAYFLDPDGHELEFVEAL